MKFFKKLRALSESHRVAAENSQETLAETIRTDPEVDREHAVALAQLCQATEQAKQLRSTDRQNHYSESLTQAFRGRTA